MTPDNIRILRTVGVFQSESIWVKVNARGAIIAADGNVLA